MKDNKLFTIPHIFKLIFLIGLVGIVHFAYLTSFWIGLRFDVIEELTVDRNYNAYVSLIPVIIIASILLADLLEMPRFFRKKNIDVVTQSVTFSFLLTTITLSAKDLLQQWAFPRSVSIMGFVVLVVYVFVWEMICAVVSHKLYEKNELVLVGASDLTIQAVKDKILPTLHSLDLNLGEPINYADKNAIRTAVRRKAEIFICPDVPDDVKSEIILMCAKNKTVAYIVPQFYEISLYKSRLIHLNDLMVFILDRMGLSFEQRIVKRVFDIIFSLIMLILTSPIMLLTALIIKCTSKGPVFFKQERLTLDNKPYNIYKFRTMVVDAEASTGAVISGKNDPRVTPIGRILRRTKIDELPQFLNVLIGEMSVVGPRSERPEFVTNFEKEIPGYSQRFAVKAGITGLAQITGNYDTTPQDKLRYDLLYIKNYSLLQDLKIIFSTVKVVITPHLYNKTFKDNQDVYIANNEVSKDEKKK